MTFKVLEFNRDDKRILVSHTRYLEDLKRAAANEERDAKRTERTKSRKAVEDQQSKIEKFINQSVPYSQSMMKPPAKATNTPEK